MTNPDPHCTAESFGYSCNRAPGHGDIHRDPKHGRDYYCHLWVFEPIDEAEACGRKPMTGYRLLTDTLITQVDNVES